MANVRWRKLLRDVWTERGRILLMIAAVAVSLAAVGAVLGAYAVLTREIAVNYLGTRPASATLEMPGGVDADLVEQVRRRPGIAEAEARETLLARARVGTEWRPLLLFVVDDFDQMRLNRFRPDTGAWPPPPGTMLVERTAVQMLEAGPGGAIVVNTPNGTRQEIRVTGTVHDPGLAPAWQERTGYGYVSRATLAAMGEAPVLHELRIEVRDASADKRSIEATVTDLAGWLAGSGHPVQEIRVPPPRKHPHQRQMVTVLMMLLAFSVMALVLSSIVVATTLSAMLARQVREIGVMKTIGARSSQIATLYVVLVAALGALSVLVAWPLGVAGASALSGAVANMLNFVVTSAAVPAWVFMTQAIAGVVVPLLIAAIPIVRASRATVRETIDQYGVSSDMLRPTFSRLPRAVRSVLRRPARLALTVGLLAAGGAMFMTALNVRASWVKNLDKFYEARHYDLEFRLQKAEDIAVVDELRRLPGVSAVEGWGYAPTSFTRPGGIEISSTYPDGNHAAFAMLAPAATTDLVSFPVLEGRWLRPGDRAAVVLNHSARAQSPDVQIGGEVTLSVNGSPTRWRLVGVVEEVGSAPVAYVTDGAFSDVADTRGRARLIRLRMDGAASRAHVRRAAERVLDEAGAGVQQSLPLAEVRTAVGDHILILIRALVAMAGVMAIVGGLGLASTMGVSVVERTREIGVMKAIGATPRRVMRDLITESILTGTLSWIIAFTVSLPLTAYVDWLIGNLGFLAPLPLAIVPGAAMGWLALVWVISFAATALPARRAARLTVREALAFT